MVARIKQIAPAAPGWRAIFRGSDGNNVVEEVVLWALLDDDDVVPLCWDAEMMRIERVDDAENFVGVRPEPEPVFTAVLRPKAGQ